MLRKNKKDIDSRLFFTLNGVLEKWGKCPWKSLKSSWIVCSKSVRTLELLYWWVGNPCRKSCDSCSSVFGSSDRMAFLVHVFFWTRVCASVFINFILICLITFQSTICFTLRMKKVSEFRFRWLFLFTAIAGVRFLLKGCINVFWCADVEYRDAS